MACAAALLLEDLGLTAYTGVLDLLEDDAKLQLAEILSVESYQSSLCRSWLNQDGTYPVHWSQKLQVNLSIYQACMFGTMRHFLERILALWTDVNTVM